LSESDWPHHGKNSFSDSGDPSKKPGPEGGGVKGIILFELNEVPLRIIEYFIDHSPASNLAKHYDKFRRYRTYTEDTGHLSPWKTWPTLHRGVSDEGHRLHDFGQSVEEVDRTYPPIWKILSAHGVATGVFGSFHSYPLPRKEAYCFYVPDVFSPGPECSPDYLEPLQDLTLKMSRESGRNVSRSLPYKEVLAFVASVPKAGIRLKTLGDIGKQLASEVQQKWKSVRRRTFQTVIAFDAFLKQMEIHKPKFATFFTNHVASSMHRYWAAAFPGEYKNFGFDSDWVEMYSGEILFAMGKADEMIGDLIEFANDNDYKLIIASSMGQNAIESQPLETQVWVTWPEKFFPRVGIEGWERRPAMFPQYNFVVPAAAAGKAEAGLRSVEINGVKLAYRRDGEFFSVDFGQENLEKLEVRIDGRYVSSSDCGLENVRIEDRSTSSAYHIPEGSLLTYHRDEEGGLCGNVSTLEIAPYILRALEVPVPRYMRTGDLDSRSPRFDQSPVEEHVAGAK